MGEAKRRKIGGNMWMTDRTSPEVRALISGAGSGRKGLGALGRAISAS
jgi:hypothetical protein